MTQTDFYQIDAFADQVFAGNPAAVYFSQLPLSEDLMQKIAQENNLPETAFVSPLSGTYQLRWFTPTVEVPLCGHATLATAHMLFHERGMDQSEIRFETKSGVLTVQRLPSDQGYQLNLPANPVTAADIPAELSDILGVSVEEFYLSSDADLPEALIVTDNPEKLRHLSPDLGRLKQLPYAGCIVTTLSDGNDIDFISRYFAPAIGIDEDSVTGAAHCVLGPFWAERLKKSILRGYQASARGGTVLCQIHSDTRILLSGRCHTYLKGNIFY